MTDQTRADFEAHFQLTQRQAWQHKDGSYQFPEIQAKWEGYQAGVAKAASAVERCKDCNGIGYTGYGLQNIVRNCQRCQRCNGTGLAAAAPGAGDQLRNVLQEIVQSAIAPGRAAEAESYIPPHLLHKAESLLR